MRATLADTMVTASAGVAATIMLDQSMPNDEGGNGRLSNVVAALENRIKAMPPSSVVGLWTFDAARAEQRCRPGHWPTRSTASPAPRP